MYARSLTKRERSSPPPGYMGTAFGQGASSLYGGPSGGGEPMEGKRHTPEEYGREGRSAPVLSVPPQNGSSVLPVREDKGISRALTDLLGDLRGRIGTEEALLLVVMLLLASDGAGAETLLLGVILLAGGE